MANDGPLERTPPPAQRLRRFATALGIRKALKALVGTLGFDLVKRHPYSPVPDVGSLHEDVWTRRSALGGLQLDPEAQLAFIEGRLAPHIAAWSPPRGRTATLNDFFLDNGTYGPVDAELLYAMIREARPARVLEIGSGFSSLVIGEALAANRADGAAGRHEIVDPFPASCCYEMGGADALREVAELKEISATEVPLESFETLAAGDILFVDSTHTVKVGGDVNWLVLDALPVLQPGVLVHFHDVYLPWEYPRESVERHERYWGEQYLLQAFLAFNERFEVVLAAQLLTRDFGPRLARTIPSTEGASPLALWLRRVG